MWTQVGLRKYELDGVHRAHWRYLANTIEPSMCGGDAAFFKLVWPLLLLGMS